MFNALVIVMTLIAAAFIVVWWLRPRFRAWIEAPKYRLQQQIRRFEEAARRR